MEDMDQFNCYCNKAQTIWKMPNMFLLRINSYNIAVGMILKAKIMTVKEDILVVYTVLDLML